MTLPSVKHNFLFNLTNTSLKILFPLILLPYVSRVLLPEGIGRVNYAEAIINYFILFSSLGIPLYGIREIAKHREEPAKLFQKLAGIFSVNFCLVIFSYVILLICLSFSFIEKEFTLVLINSSLIFFSLIEVEWFFQGTENYRYITIRNMIIKSISLILVFTCVKTKDDTILYAMILVFGIGGNALFNFFYIMKTHGKEILPYFKLSFFKQAFKEHIKAIVITSAMALAASIYLNLDVIMLGYFSTNVEVGYYTACMKIVRVLITVVLALLTVLLPRSSYLVSNKHMDEFVELIRLSFKFICFIGFPCIIGILLLSKSIIFIFFGQAFYPAYSVMNLLCILLFFVSMNNLLGMQILYPLNRERKFLYSILAGALVNVVSNLFLIYKFKAVGASIGSILAEAVIFFLLFLSAKDYFKLSFFKKGINYLIASGVMALVIFGLNQLLNINIYIDLFIKVSAAGITYLLVLLLLKETEFLKAGIKLVLKK